MIKEAHDEAEQRINRFILEPLHLERDRYEVIVAEGAISDVFPIGTAVGLLTGSLIGLLGGPVGLVVGAYGGVIGGVAYDLVQFGGQ